jgi:hypothetical protein
MYTALTDVVFVTKTQCDQFITLSLKIHNVLPLSIYVITLDIATCFIPQGISARNRYQMILYETKVKIFVHNM